MPLRVSEGKEQKMVPGRSPLRGGRSKVRGGARSGAWPEDFLRGQRNTPGNQPLVEEARNQQQELRDVEEGCGARFCWRTWNLVLIPRRESH